MSRQQDHPPTLDTRHPSRTEGPLHISICSQVVQRSIINVPKTRSPCALVTLLCLVRHTPT